MRKNGESRFIGDAFSEERFLKGNKSNVDLEETLTLYVKLGFSLNDAGVSTWNDKYEHMVMRPNVFIHDHIDPTYQTNLYRLIPWSNPTFSAYPSGTLVLLQLQQVCLSTTLGMKLILPIDLMKAERNLEEARVRLRALSKWLKRMLIQKYLWASIFGWIVMRESDWTMKFQLGSMI